MRAGCVGVCGVKSERISFRFDEGLSPSKNVCACACIIRAENAAPERGVCATGLQFGSGPTPRSLGGGVEGRDRLCHVDCELVLPALGVRVGGVRVILEAKEVDDDSLVLQALKLAGRES